MQRVVVAFYKYDGVNNREEKEILV